VEREKRPILQSNQREEKMTENTENNNQAKISIKGICMGLGLLLGGLLGLLIDNLAFSAGGGMILGLAIGTALENRRAQA
jgi:F0F1-type ATP synthase assembly protein I